MLRKPQQVKTSLYLAPETHDKLKQISERTMIPMARLLRKAVDNRHQGVLQVAARNGRRLRRVLLSVSFHGNGAPALRVQRSLV